MTEPSLSGRSGRAWACDLARLGRGWPWGDNSQRSRL